MTHYLDHAATTPVLTTVVDAVAEQMRVVGNPSSLHTAGRAARRVVEESRERLATVLGARPSEVVFTSGGTEADNLAVHGTWAARRQADPARTRIVTTSIEHHAVLDCVEHLVKAEGARVTWVDPGPDGRVDPAAVRAAVEEDPDDVALVSVMWANNEVGVVQPVAEVAEVAHTHGIPVHTDAVQALGHVPLDFAASGVDLMSVTGHKIGGPVGTGVLLARREAGLVPLSHGGGQERGVRSGTLDVPGIRGFAVAAEHVAAHRETEVPRLLALRDRLVEEAAALGLGITVSGAWAAGDAAGRLANNAHLLVPDCEGDSLLYLLDAAGIECSTGSACRAGVPQPSHVLLAMGRTEAQARGALRLTLGHTSTEEDVDAVLAALPGAVERARSAHGAA